jgi:ParB family chromosome partitioning protein
VAGKKEMDCLVQVVGDNLELYRRSFLINEQRNAQSPLDNAIAWRRLLDEKLLASADEIAESIGVSKANVAKTLSFLKIPEQALAKVREAPSKFGIAIGYEISRCAQVLSTEDLVELIDRIVREDLSSRQVEALRSKLESKDLRKPKEVSRQYKLKSGSTQIGFIKEWDSGKVALEVKILDSRERETLVEELKRRFGVE